MNLPAIRPELLADVPAVHSVVASAFETDAEARLVDALRASGNATIALVAEQAGSIVGHILFSPVTLDGSTVPVLGLAPVSVAPAHQRQGIGGALIRDGLARVAALGYTAVVLLGHPEYYPRFGFIPASRFGLRCEYDCPDEAFMAIELAPGALSNHAGLIQYRPEFAEL